jgi:hypothetical protein
MEHPQDNGTKFVGSSEKVTNYEARERTRFDGMALRLFTLQ